MPPAVPHVILVAMTTQGESDQELATRLAQQAGHHLVELRDRLFAQGSTSWQVMDAGDQLGHRFIGDELRRVRPDDAILDEEGYEDPRRFTTDRVWIIDPLDGSREYGEQGRPDWAVHVACWDHGRFAAGAVALPAADVVIAASPPPTRTASQRSRPRIVTSRFHAPYAAVLAANALGCDAIRMGSAGAKAMAVVTGEADIYIHDGGMYQWDSAAPVAVAAAAGLHTSRLDGSPLVYNARSAWLPDLIICRPDLADPIHEALWGSPRPSFEG